MKEFYTIQEFAQLSGVEASTLRYWDEIGIFSPITRNPENNYRYYTAVQLLALNFVTVLSDLDFPLKAIADLRQERDPEKLMRMLDKQEMQMDMEMRRLRMRYSIIHARRELLNYGMRVDETEISVGYRACMPIVLWPSNTYREGDTFIEPLADFIQDAESHHVNLSFPVGGRFDSMALLAEAPDRPQHFFSIDPVGMQAREEGEYLIGYGRGYYGEMGSLPERMLAFAEENNISLAGPAYAIYLLEETSVQNNDDYLVELSASISKQNTARKG